MIGLLEERWEVGNLPRKYSFGPVLPKKPSLKLVLPDESSLKPDLPKKSSLTVLTSYRKLGDLESGDHGDSVRYRRRIMFKYMEKLNWLKQCWGIKLS